MLVLLALALFDRRALLAPQRPEPREIVTVAHLRFDQRRRREPAPLAPRRTAAPRRVAVVPHPRTPRVVTPRPVRPQLVTPQLLRPRLVTPRVMVGPRAVAPREIAKNGSLPLPAPAERGLGDARIAQIERSLGAAIANDRRGRDPLAVEAGPPVTSVHHGLDVNGFTTGDRDHHGLCDPVKSWADDGYDYYYVACNVRFSDGTVERQSVPWPIRFSPADDPFAGTARSEKPLAAPLAGWHLPPSETVSAELRAYARELGADL